MDGQLWVEPVGALIVALRCTANVSGRVAA